jgi:hypothetical protein
MHSACFNEVDHGANTIKHLGDLALRCVKNIVKFFKNDCSTLQHSVVTGANATRSTPAQNVAAHPFLENGTGSLHAAETLCPLVPMFLWLRGCTSGPASTHQLYQRDLSLPSNVHTASLLHILKQITEMHLSSPLSGRALVGLEHARQHRYY